MQCSSDGEESLKCDNYNKAGECKSDGSLKCQGSARFFEHVLAKSDDAVNGYISAAGRYWDSGYREVARADTWKHALEHKDLSSDWGNNSLLTVSEIVFNHKSRLAGGGFMFVVNGTLVHPLSPNLKSVSDFLESILNILPKLVASVAKICTISTATVMECLKILGLSLTEDEMISLLPPSAGKPNLLPIVLASTSKPQSTSHTVGTITQPLVSSVVV